MQVFLICIIVQPIVSWGVADLLHATQHWSFYILVALFSGALYTLALFIVERHFPYKKKKK
jgi:hypothetical protein